MALIVILYFSIIVTVTNGFGAGSDDMVLVKYDSSGVQQWNRTWGGIDDDGGWGVAVDSFDNVYLCGYTSKREEEQPPISGYDLLLFISVIGVITAITAIFLNKKYNK